MVGAIPYLWDWGAAAWAALGVWATFGVYVVIGLYARRQVAEARRLREEQARPWVVVDFEPTQILWLTIENIGKTVATDVRIRIDPPLVSTQARPWVWEDSPTFTEGIPMLPPRKKLRFFFDASHAQVGNKDLPKQYDVFVEYHGPVREGEPLTSTWRLDIGHYFGMSPPPKGIAELVTEVEKVHKEMNKWTAGISGLKVRTFADEIKEDRWRLRPYLIQEAKRIRASDGWLALGQHLVRRAMQRRGWRVRG